MNKDQRRNPREIATNRDMIKVFETEGMGFDNDCDDDLILSASAGD